MDAGGQPGVLTHFRRTLVAVALTGLVPGIGFIGVAHAANKSWQSTNGSWHAAGNWNGGLPGSGDTAIFGNPAGPGPWTISVASGTQVAGIQFSGPSANADPFVFSGAGSLTIHGGGVTNTHTDSDTFNVGITLGANQTWDVQAAGNLTFGGAITGAGKTLTLQGSSSGLGRITGSINGLGGIVKNGSGAWTISTGAITLGGSQTWNLNNGSLSVSSQVTAAAGEVLTLQAASAKSATLSGALTGAGSLNKASAGTWVLSGANSFSGGVAIDAGTLRFSGANTNLGPVAIGNGGLLEVGATNTLPAATGLTLNGGTLKLGGTFNQGFSTALAVTANSVIDFGAGAGAGTISFGNSNSAAWTGTLTISNYVAGSDALRFGTSGAGLTATQLAAINFGGLAAQMDAAGFVSPVPEPSTYAGLAGVAALGFAAYRRRTARRQAV